MNEDTQGGIFVATTHLHFFYTGERNRYEIADFLDDFLRRSEL